MKTRRFSPTPWLIALALSLSLFSCRSSKDLIYMRDIQDNQLIKALADTVTEYIIEPGDILYVSIKSMNNEVNAMFNPESNMETGNSNSYQKFTTPQGAYLYGFEVDERGNITLPVIGEVPVAGAPNSKIEDIVQQYADHYLKEAIVKVKLMNYKVTIMGEVKNPGVYYNYNNRFTILEALAMANGNTDYANLNKITVIRPQADGQKAMVLDMSGSDAWLQKGFYLHPNDYVFVEPSRHKNFQLNAQVYSMIISSVSLLLAVISTLN